MKRLIFLLLLLLSTSLGVKAQSTFGVTQGWGWGTIRSYPSIETKPLYGLSTTSFSWRHYSKDRYVGGFGIDLEFMQRGFAYAPYTSTNNNDEGNEDVDLLYYTRHINSVVLPIVWQPHVYMFHNTVRLFGDACVTFSYNYSSTYQNDLYNSYGFDDPAWEGDYDMRDERDNHWGYGLAFGGGIAYLHGRYEFQASMRYYFGYSDILKNRNKYYSNTTDGPENPFSYTPLRSPIDNFNFKVGVSYRMGNKDFAAWHTVRIKNPGGLRSGFDYEGETNTTSKSGRR